MVHGRGWAIFTLPLALHESKPWLVELWQVDTSHGRVVDTPLITAFRGVGDVMHPPVMVPGSNTAHVLYRWSTGEPNTTGGGQTVIRWSQHIGTLQESGDIIPVDNDGRQDRKSGWQAFLISDEGWSLARGGNALLVASWHGIYGLDVTTHQPFPVLLHSREQPSDIMDQASVAVFERLVEESREAGDALPPAISGTFVFFQYDNQLVALRGEGP